MNPESLQSETTESNKREEERKTGITLGCQPHNLQSLPGTSPTLRTCASTTTNLLFDFKARKRIQDEWNSFSF